MDEQVYDSQHSNNGTPRHLDFPAPAETESDKKQKARRKKGKKREVDLTALRISFGSAGT